MNLRTTAGFVLLSVGATFAAASAPPTHPAVLSATMVNDNAPYPECHASTLVETTPGKLVAAWFGGTKERNPDVTIWVAHHEQGRWQPGTSVADGVQESGPRLPTWNPVLFQPPRGPLVLFYKIGPSPSRWWGMVKTSTDGGRTWSAGRRLPEGILGPVKNKPVLLRDGSWLSASSTEGNPTGWRVQFESSRDEGATWTKIGPVEKGDPPLDMIQPSVLIHRDGTLQAMGRTRNGAIGSTVSRDDGKTWTPLAKSELPNPNSGTDAVTLADGRHLMVYNHSTTGSQRQDKGDRYPLDIAISSDGAKWQRVLTLETEPISSGYAYPAVIQTKDGRVHVTYTFGRAKIKHVLIDPAKLR